MTTRLTAAGYAGTKKKLAQLEARLETLLQRTDLEPLHRAEVERSYRDMIRQYRHDIKLYEAAHDIEPKADGTALSPNAVPHDAPAPEGS
jgi:hypothetical protein